MIPIFTEARPDLDAGVRLQPRDRAALCALHLHRFLTAEYLQLVAYTGASERVVQRRLRALWAAGYIDRGRVVLADTRGSLRAARPLYALAPLGGEVVADALGLDLAAIPTTPAANRQGYETLQHHLVATDFLVALTAAVRGRHDVQLAAVLREDELRRRLAQAHRPAGGMPAVVPDSAFVLQLDPDERPRAFALEVVRAGVPGGNTTLVAKMKRYVALNRAGFFGAVYGLAPLRAVLILTTSPARAAGFADLAAVLPHGRGLFWTTSYERKGDIALAFDPSTILGPIFEDAAHAPRALASA